MSAQSEYLKRCRGSRSVRSVAHGIGLSHVFWGEVERGMHVLGQKHWPRVIDTLESATWEGLEEATMLTTGIISIDLSGASMAVRDLVQLVSRKVRASVGNESVCGCSGCSFIRFLDDPDGDESWDHKKYGTDPIPWCCIDEENPNKD